MVALVQVHDGQFVLVPFLHMCTPLMNQTIHASLPALSWTVFISYACAAYNDENRIELKLLCVYAKMKHSIANYFIKQNEKMRLWFPQFVTLCLW